MLDLTLALIFIGFGSVVYYFYKWTTRNNDYFEKRGVKYTTPSFLLGNTGGIFFKKIDLIEFLRQQYDAFPKEKISGFFSWQTPIYFLRDVQLLKQISTKDFDSFGDHKFIIEPESDSLMGNTVFMMKGKRWREMRATLSPAFTGNKMRLMFNLIRDVASDSSKYLLDEAKIKGPQTYEMRELFSKFANDVIASCAFGLKINSIEDPENYFYKIGRTFDDLASFKTFVRIMVKNALPQLTNAFGMEFFESHIRKFFKDIFLKNIHDRKTKGIIRPDMIDLLMRAQEKAQQQFATGNENEKEETNWSDIELVSQCFVFFLGGFDTVTWGLTACSHRIVANQEVQAKLVKEVDEVNRLLDGRDISYDDLKDMRYLDAVVSEVMRMDGPAAILDRVCTKDYHIDELDLTIEKDSILWAPAYLFHRNPEVFFDPERFDPERFNEENKKNINMDYYLPFGIGPRACIGNRFALMELKAVIYFLLSHFTFDVAPKTVLPMPTTSSFFGFRPINGFHIELRPRK